MSDPKTDKERYLEIAEPFWLEASASSPPKFVIVTGGTGSGKTTQRRKKYSKYVNFDFGEIEIAVKNAYAGVPEETIKKTAILLASFIFDISLQSKRDIVIEMIGDNLQSVKDLQAGMSKAGYDVSVDFVYCDPKEAYRRHVEAVANDPAYTSAYFTQWYTTFIIYNKLGLGDVPFPPAQA